MDVIRWSKVDVPAGLLEDLLPGPVTVVLERSASLNPCLNPGTSKVGIRIPNHSFMIALARACGGPLALTSANISATQSTLNIQVMLMIFIFLLDTLLISHVLHHDL